MRSYRIKDVARINARTLPESTDPDYTFRYIDIGSVDSLGNITIPEEETSFATSPSRARRLAPPRSVIVSTVRTYLRAVAFVPTTDASLVFSTGFAVLEATDNLDPRFLAYHCQSEPFIDEVVARSVGVSYPAINASEIGNLPVRVPSFEEQHRLADFLDAETARIDRLVSLRRRQLDVSVEAIAARAAEATGRVASLRDSLPFQQIKLPLRRAVRSVQTGSTPGGLQEYTPSGSQNLRPWYTPAALNGILSMGRADKAISLDQIDDAPTFQAGSVLIAGIGESLGKIGYLDHAATGNQQLTAIQPDGNSDGRFLAWQLWAAQEEIREWAQYSRIRIINNDVLKSFPIYLPNLSDQIRARKELDERRHDFERLGDAVRRFLERIKEHRQALITAAVTGQIDISTASGRGIED
ncbi:restriction endonuclease subunit S [Micromonospora sp. NPDC049751]|uniref:restriction endonuclease subunit S n=1 Tax=Micromonospora sp. NPDC049751 TaxID=3154837 RepID=UPI0033E48240